ncbi:MAG: DUF692 family multinuclear iron-containing protein [Anaerolineae bacterium]
MDYALNYSAAAAELIRRGAIEIDLFKCAAWPDMIASAQALGRVYIHFPLRVGMGTGDALNTETNSAPDWNAIERMLAETSTPWINVHLGPRPEDHPAISVGSTAPADVEQLTESLIRDVAAVVDRFGADRVLGENIFGAEGMHPRAAVLPNVVREVVETTGCGFLLDLSHARLAAEELDMAPKAYIEALPVDRIKEIHVTGIQRFGEQWVARAQAMGMDKDTLRHLKGRRIDHLPMTSEDWSFMRWSLAQTRDGVWQAPDIVAFEYGGIGDFFRSTTVEEALVVQVPRMYDLVKSEAALWVTQGGVPEPFWSSS